jgi:hypothetical protein
MTIVSWYRSSRCFTAGCSTTSNVSIRFLQDHPKFDFLDLAISIIAPPYSSPAVIMPLCEDYALAALFPHRGRDPRYVRFRAL